MHHPITLQYTEPLLREAAFVFWRRTVGIGFFLALALLLCSLLLMLWQGDRSWFVGMAGTFLVIGLGFAWSLYFVHLRNAMAKFRAMGSPVATLCLEDTCFTVSSTIGSSSLQWSSVTELWRYPSFWLLFFSKAQFVTIPLASVPSEAQAFILDRVSTTGGKVVG